MNLRRTLRNATLVAACCAAAALSSAADDARFAVEKDDAGKFWFREQDGDRFLSLGLNHIDSHTYNPPAGSDYYDALGEIFAGDIAKWRASAFSIMRSAGFNTIGAWSHPKLNDGTMLETPILYVAGHAKERMLSGLRPDFEDTVRANVRTILAAMDSTDRILGVFLDNEMAWYGKSPWDPNPRYTMLEEAMTLPAHNPERRAVVEFLQSRHVSAEAFAAAWEIDAAPWDALSPAALQRSRTAAAMADREALIEAAAESFYERAARVVRAEMPGVLVLGTRFAGNAPDGVIRACGKHCDVVSFNNYRATPTADEELLARYWLLGGKPLMITEYGWRGAENASGNRNSRGAGSIVKTQRERGENYASFVSATLARPMVVGMHWFEWADQSPQGRFDGEDSNYGLVDIRNVPYADVAERMAATNARAAEIHATSTIPFPTAMPAPPAVIVEPGQFPDRAPLVDLLRSEPAAPHGTFAAPDAGIGIESLPEGGMKLSMDTGATWGCGVALHGPKAMAVAGAAAWAVDLDGYSRIVIEGEFPRDMEILVAVDEAGVAEPGSPTFDTRAGDDGESFAFDPVIAQGGPQTIALDLHDLRTRGVWGNQAGKKRLDLPALKGVAVVFGGGAGTATVLLRSARFEK